MIHTYRREQVDTCRRIFVLEECVVPPRHEANFPVRVMYDNIHCPSSDWAIEPRVIRPGVVAARTLLSDDRVDVVARVCNYSDTSHVFKADSFLGLAEPVRSDVGDGCVGSAVQAGSAGQAESAAPVGSAGTCRNMTDPPGGLRTADTAERKSPRLIYSPCSEAPEPSLTTGQRDS